MLRADALSSEENSEMQQINFIKINIFMKNRRHVFIIVIRNTSLEILQMIKKQ